MAISTTTQLTQPVNVIHQADFLRSAKPRCPYFAGALPGDIMSHRGSFTIQWRSMTALTPTTTALTELSGASSYPTRTATALAISDTTATLAKYGDFVEVTEEADLINYTTQDAKIVETLGIQAGQSLNRLQRNIGEDNATLVYTDGASADSGVVSAVSRAVIRSARNTLQRNSALEFTPETMGSQNIATTPIRPAYLGLCHSDVEEDIRDLAGFIAAERYSGQTRTYNGEFGMLDGVRFISSPEASIDTDSGGSAGAGLRTNGGTNADLYTTLIFGLEAHGSVGLDFEHLKEVYMAGDPMPGVQLIAHARGSAGAADALNELATMGWKAYHAGAILNSNWIRGVRSGASLLE